MKRYITAALIIVCSILINAQAKFTVSPPKYEISIYPEDEKTFIISVENMGDTTVHIKTVISDWDLDIEDRIQFFPPQTFKNSCSSWFYINPLEFNIAPHTIEDVRITMSVPQNVFGEYKSMIFFESSPFSPEYGSMIMFNSRVGCTIYAEIIGTVSYNGEILEMGFDREKGVNVLFRNTGNKHERIEISLQIFNDEGHEIYLSSLSDQLVLPDREREFILPVETRLDNGIYKLKVLLDYGGTELLAGEKTLKVGQ